ncbi:MAG: DUF5320 domain-containing protein [Candidatus Marinimicrobia bacterium]|nr:DUF5320 domain-containing protein [Candidatus Neomarinimicrobiota bacterium]
MPRGDRTGPQGRGSMTGRRLGRCTGNEDRNFGYGFGGRGRGQGSFGGRFGMGGGRGNGYGYGYRTNFQETDYENTVSPSNTEGTELRQQLTTVIDQLSKLLKQSAESGEAKNETK